MPQTSDEMLDYMRSKHGPDFDDHTAMSFLESRGFKINADWSWTPPPGVTLENMDEDDRKHVIYLIEEWDFDGIKC